MTSLALIWFGAFLAVWSLCRYMSNVWVRDRRPLIYISVQCGWKFDRGR